MRRFYAIILLLLIAAALFLNFPVDSGLVRQWLGLGHVIIGLLLALVAETFIPRKITSCVFISVALSSAAELLQPLFGRSDSLSDLAFAISGALLLPVLKHKKSDIKPSFIVLPALSLFFFALAISPLITSSMTRFEQKAAFPLIFASDRPETLAWATEKTKKNLPRLPIEIAFDPLLQMKWSDYSQLEISFYAEQEGQHLNLRLDDNGDCEEFADRLNHSWITKTGKQTVRFNLKKHHMTDSLRPFNYCCVSRIIIFSPKGNNDIVLQNIKLR